MMPDLRRKCRNAVTRAFADIAERNILPDAISGSVEEMTCWRELPTLCRVSCQFRKRSPQTDALNSFAVFASSSGTQRAYMAGESALSLTSPRKARSQHDSKGVFGVSGGRRGEHSGYR
jgi:hypothetical protein